MLEGMRRNLPIKLTSLLFAILLWGMVAGQKEVVRQLDVPLVLPVLADSRGDLHLGEPDLFAQVNSLLERAIP